ncbi:hypothetical protein NQZ68_008631 [Dissostichus eleginoides]|nr:hypothetical protein NQZ68_008631 [Dissostichus eleginoides]
MCHFPLATMELLSPYTGAKQTLAKVCSPSPRLRCLLLFPFPSFSPTRESRLAGLQRLDRRSRSGQPRAAVCRSDPHRSDVHVTSHYTDNWTQHQLSTVICIPSPRARSCSP